ncbi:MAG: hypothetical protein DCC43_16180 [Candidatus Brocadia sp.]|nr:MAG: hypothetical protein DCC43_16180 [Candidatus Brocadia sp.]
MNESFKIILFLMLMAINFTFGISTKHDEHSGFPLNTMIFVYPFLFSGEKGNKNEYSLKIILLFA